MLEAYSEVDKDLAMLNGNTAEFRLSEDVAFLEAMNQTRRPTMFYGNPGTDPKTVPGPRAALQLAVGHQRPEHPRRRRRLHQQRQHLAGGLGQDHGVLPLPQGLEGGPSARRPGRRHRDRQLPTGRFQALRTHYQWKNGLAVKDWRYVVRICNINTANLVAESSAANLIKLMTRALFRVPNLRAGRPVFYMNRTVAQMLPIQGLNNSSNAVKVQEAINQFGEGHRNMSFLGVPIRLVRPAPEHRARVT
jgi:hypothetical protein